MCKSEHEHTLASRVCTCSCLRALVHQRSQYLRCAEVNMALTPITPVIRFCTLARPFTRHYSFYPHPAAVSRALMFVGHAPPLPRRPSRLCEKMNANAQVEAQPVCSRSFLHMGMIVHLLGPLAFAGHVSTPGRVAPTVCIEKEQTRIIFTLERDCSPVGSPRVHRHEPSHSLTNAAPIPTRLERAIVHPLMLPS